MRRLACRCMRIRVDDTVFNKPDMRSPRVSGGLQSAKNKMREPCDDMERNDALSNEEHLWEGTTTRRACAPMDEDTQAPHMRVAENDFIELHEGAEGQTILVRRGLHLKYLDSRKQADLDWPSFDDDV
jgi:hypothetical protein